MRSYLRRGRLTCDHGFPLAGVLPSGEYLVCATVNSTHLQEHRALHLELTYVVIVRSPHNSSILVFFFSGASPLVWFDLFTPSSCSFLARCNDASLEIGRCCFDSNGNFGSLNRETDTSSPRATCDDHSSSSFRRFRVLARLVLSAIREGPQTFHQR